MTRRPAGPPEQRAAAPPVAGQFEAVLSELDAGRGARDAVVFPIPTSSPGAVPEVRSTVRDILEAQVPPDIRNEVQLVCSELATNALTHGEPPMKLLLHETDSHIVVAVFDRGEGTPQVTDDGASGLHIVDELTDHCWGHAARDGGKWVWAAVRRAAAG